MNLKTKSSHRLTAVVKLVDDTTAIFSDECSPTHIDALSIITATTKQDLWNAIRTKALQTAADAKFTCTIALIHPDNTLEYKRAEPQRYSAL